MRILENKAENAAQAIDDRIDSILFDLETSAPAISKATAILAQEADQMKENPQLDTAARTWLGAYVDRLADIQQEQFRYLYKQGALDCVEALRKVGVIK